MYISKTKFLKILTLFIICAIVFIRPDSFAKNKKGESISPSLNIEVSNQVRVVVDPDNVIRTEKTPLYLGFNTQWYALQESLWDYSKHQIYPEIIDFLKESPGLVYRYPGGTVSQFYNWKECIGPLKNRIPQRAHKHKPIITEFGFNEFIQFVKQVNGRPMIVVNMVSMTPEDAADWVEYANLTAGANPNGGKDWAESRVSNGFKEPYNILDWELGNELDWNIHKWTVEQYIDAGTKFINAMKKVDPRIQISMHARTAPHNILRKLNWQEFHQEILRKLGAKIQGIVLHSYYDGISIPKKFNYINKIISDTRILVPENPPQLSITEHAKWPSDKKDKSALLETGSINGAISTADFLLNLIQLESVKQALWHCLSGIGPWTAFEKIDNVWQPRPVALALKLLSTNLQNGIVLKTITYTSNTSGYKGGYDLRAVTLRNTDGTGLRLIIVNRGQNQEATFKIPNLKSGEYKAYLEILGNEDKGKTISKKILNISVLNGGFFKIVLPEKSIIVITGFETIILKK